MWRGRLLFWRSKRGIRFCCRGIEAMVGVWEVSVEVQVGVRVGLGVAGCGCGFYGELRER